MNKQCRICLSNCNNTSFKNILNKLNEHYTIIEAIVQIASIQISEPDHLPQLICNKCLIKIDDLFSFRYLIICSDNALKNEVCKDQNCDAFELSNKIPSSAESCDITSKKQAQNNSLTSHTLKKLCAKSDKNYQCSECKMKFKKTDYLKSHLAYRHEEKRFQCTICKKFFATKHSLSCHIRVHTGEKPFTCEHCGKSFTSSNYFIIHKRLHLEEKKIKCSLCEKSFINSDELRIHIRRKHTGEKPYLCELCSQAFTNSSALFRHKRDVHTEKTECPICTKRYSARVLKDHIKRHREKDEGIKRYSCEQCNRTFTCAASKKRHMVIHTGVKAFACQLCDKAFNQRSTLQTHMRIHSQIMPFQCNICDVTFRYKHRLKHHTEMVHNANLILK